MTKRELMKLLQRLPADAEIAIDIQNGGAAPRIEISAMRMTRTIAGLRWCSKWGRSIVYVLSAAVKR